MTKNDILLSITSDDNYIEMCKTICKGKDVYKDLYQYTMLYVCEMPEEKLILLNNQNIKGYIHRIIWFNAHNTTGQFYREYKGRIDLVEYDASLNLEESAEEESAEEWKSALNKSIEKTLEDERKKSTNYAWNVELFKIWIKNNTNYRKVARLTTIPYPTVRYNILEMIKKINENSCNNN